MLKKQTRKTLKTRVVFAVSLIVFCILCSINAQAADLKIGFVDPRNVLEEAPQAEAARKQLEKEFAPRDKKLVELQNNINALEEKLARDVAVMSETEQRRLEREVLSLKREFKREKDEFWEDFNIRRNELFDKLRRRVFEVIQTIGKQKKFDLIVSESVVYASENINITAEVVKSLKEEMKNKQK